MYSSGKLDTYTVFKKSRVNFNDFFKDYKNLLDNKIICEVDNFILISKDYIDKLNYLLRDIGSRDKTWRKVPGKMLGESIGIDNLYIPSRSKMELKTFNLKNNE